MRPVGRNNARPAATSPLRAPPPKTTREFDAYPIRVNSRHPLTNEFHNLRCRHVTLCTAQQVPSSLNRTLDRNLRSTVAIKGIEALKHTRHHRRYQQAPKRLRGAFYMAPSRAIVSP